MKNPKGGRPAQYTYEQLLELLIKYTEEHPNQTIRLFELEKVTGIKRYIWSYNMMDEIDKINKEIQKVNVARTGITSLPSAEQIFISCNGNEKELVSRIESLLDMVRDLSKYQDAAVSAKTIKDDYESKLDELECIIKEKDKQIGELFAQINRITCDSDNPNLRSKYGIKGNLLELTPENIEAFEERRNKLLL